MKVKKIFCVATLAAAATLTLASCGSETKAYSKFDSTSSDYDAKYSDAELDKSVLGDFNTAYTAAKSEMVDLNKRYAQLALSEAKLLESGVFIPLNTQGGMYALTKVAPRMIPDTKWGNDYERFHTLAVTTTPIKKADRDKVIAAWKVAKAAALATGAETKTNVTGIAWKNTVKTTVLKDYQFQDTYTKMYTSDPKTWDAVGTSRAADSEAILGTYDGLVQYNALGQIAPAMASDWSHNADYTKFEFTIRSGAKWVTQSGEDYADVTAEDFVTGFQHMLDCAAGLEYLVQGVVKNVNGYLAGEKEFSEVGVKASGNKLTFELESSTPWFMTMLGYGIFAPVNKAFYESKGGKFGSEFDSKAENYKYGQTASDILCCGAFRVTNSTAKTKIEFTKNDKYWDAENVDLKTVTWLYNDGTDTTLTFKNFNEGKIDGCTLNNSTLSQAKASTAKYKFDDYAYVSDTNATTYNAFLNVKRQAYKNADGKAKTTKNQGQADVASQAFLNKDFRLALCYSLDRGVYNAQTTGEDVKLFSLRNTYVPGDFVSLTADTTVEINGTKRTFAAGTNYGEILQAQLTADGSEIVAYKNGSTDGFDGWYNQTAAKAHFETAVKALNDSGVKVDENNPIVVELPTFTGSDIYKARANAFKKSVEETLGKMIKVELVDCQTADDWYNAGYYTETGKEANYDVYDLSGWGPDYGDPSTYLDTMYVDADGAAGYMIKCIGLF